MTNKRKIARVLKASAVLLDTPDMKLRAAILDVARELILPLWTESYLAFKQHRDIRVFWNEVIKQTERSFDVVKLNIAWSRVGDNYGQRVRVQLTIKPNDETHVFEIIAGQK